MALLRLTLHHAKPYWAWVVGVLVLQLLSTIAALWLPSLNAQIIDQGITRGDIDFIWSTGGLMLIVSFAQLIAVLLAVGEDAEHGELQHVTATTHAGSYIAPIYRNAKRRLTASAGST